MNTRFWPTLRSWLWTLFCLIVVVSAFNLWRTRDIPTQAPHFSAPLLNGDRFDLNTSRVQHPNQPLALIFWAQWCPICRTEEHSINRLVHDPDLKVLVVATQSGDAQAVKQTLRERGHDDWNVLIDEEGDLMRAFGFSAVPVIVVIDAQGQIRHPQIGYTSELGMRARLWLSRF